MSFSLFRCALVSRRDSARRPARRRILPTLERLEDRTVPTVVNPTSHLLVNPGGFAPAGSAGQPGGFSPAQIRHAYGFDQITFNNGAVQGDGAGQTIAIVDAYSQPNIVSDLAAFDSTYGIAAPPKFSVVNESGGSTLPTADQNWGLEISLDVEWAHAIAPGANILLVEANSSGFSDLISAVNYARNQTGVSVVSMSWGAGEFSGETAYDSYFTTPSGHNGVTFVASTGDSGSSGAPESPSVSANVLAVGGTQLSTDVSGNYLSETGWSGSGGGISAYESQPAYQKGVVTQTSTMRAVPDVSYDGSSSSPFAVYDTSSYGGWIQVYGTSAGAPQWAALVAVADQGLALSGKGSLDGATQTLPDLYKLPGSDFHDVTTGSNGAYSAGAGYDLVTGRGSPYANLIVDSLAGVPILPPTPPPSSTGGTAAFVKTDATDQGSWQGVYGAQGTDVAGAAASVPSYAQVTLAGQSSWTWAASTTDLRALQNPAGGRLAACWYGSAFTVDVNLTDSLTHQVGLYFLDWDNGGRSQRVDVLDAASGAVLDSRTVSSFTGGQYLVWNLSGHVTFRVTDLTGPNAVIGGLFFDAKGGVPTPPPSSTSGTAAYVKTDTTDEGTWQGVYGAQGTDIAGAAASVPSYAQVTLAGQQSWTWTGLTTDPRALQNPVGGRLAACWYGSSFTVDVNLTDGQTHQVGLYFLDWDNGGRSQRVDVLDAASGAVLDSRTVSSFTGGQYLVWNLSGHVTFRVTDLTGVNAVLSGLFFGGSGGTTIASSTAVYLKTNTTVQGSWEGAAGTQGTDVAGAAANVPSYAQVTLAGQSSWTWAASTTDLRALQNPAGGRIAACWYGSTFTVDVNLTDGQTHQVGLYFLDWDNGGRTERVDVLDAATGSVLDSRTVSSFTGGQYLVWNLSGHVTFHITDLTGVNAVLSGLFFDAKGATGLAGVTKLGAGAGANAGLNSLLTQPLGNGGRSQASFGAGQGAFHASTLPSTGSYPAAHAGTPAHGASSLDAFWVRWSEDLTQDVFGSGVRD